MACIEAVELSTETASVTHWSTGLVSSSSTGWSAFASLLLKAYSNPRKQTSMDAGALVERHPSCHRPSTVDEVHRVLTSTRLNTSPVDVLLTFLLLSPVHVFAPVVTHMANLLFTEHRFPAVFKTAQALPLLKNSVLDKEQISSYRPVFDLMRIFEVIERLTLVRRRYLLLASLNFARLQSAYRYEHSTETALLRVISSHRQQEGQHIGQPRHTGSRQ